jgi:glycogen operon protein
VEDGVQFTIFSRHATRVWLMLFDGPGDTKPCAEYELSPDRHRIGDIWHIHLSDARAGQCYAYRMDGRSTGVSGNHFNPRQWLLDPYALAVAWSDRWGDGSHLKPGRQPRAGREFPKGVIVRDDFDWSGDRTPNIPLAETVIYEAHLRGFTAHPRSGVAQRGTFGGFIETIPYLRELGITAVEFLPLQEFNEMEFFLENMGRRHLRNLWGYSTLAFFAPNGRYASASRGGQVAEFKQLVMALHRAGIEVILDVVFNHSGEAGDGGPTYSFRGIDNSIYYMMESGAGRYLNYSGCGNTFNSNHPVVRNFIMDCLRYWVLHLHVDGFRFDLASVLARGPGGELLPNPPIVEQIAEDPALRHTKIIAEAWDAAGTYHVGSFPSDRWSEWNGRFRDEVRRFWKGERGLLGAFATRLAGSSDLYRKNGQSPLKSINFVTCHDGFTLADLVRYERKRNEANGEENRDGETLNHSANHGHEGPSSDPGIEAVRRRQQKNLLATVFLAQGVPMLLAGDEFGRTQGGNNNAYCQDNETSWIDWSLLAENSDLFDFARALVAFRKSHPSLRRTSFLRGEEPGREDADIRWYGPRGDVPDWAQGQAVACLLDGRAALTGAAQDADHLFLAFNAGDEPVVFHVPPPPGSPWRLEITSEASPPRHEGRHILHVAPKSVTVLASAPA